MKRRIGLLAPFGAAVVALACLVASQTLVPTAAMAKHPDVGTIALGDPGDGNHAQFTDPVQPEAAAPPPMTLTAPIDSDESPSAPPAQRPECLPRPGWRFLACRIAQLALRLFLKF